MATVGRYNTNRLDPRFGWPETYNITTADPNSPAQTTTPGSQTTEVHWSRCIHIADNISKNKVFGVPRMRPVLNRLLDLRKLYAACAEMYWKGAFFGLSFQTHPTLGGEVDVDKEGLKHEYEEFMNGLQRAMFTAGLDVKTLAPNVVDPTPQILVLLQAICIQLDIPMRILMGSERGNLASTQDDAKWNDILRARQVGHVTPRVICPFFDRLISLEVLPEPEGYTVDWPDITSQTQADKADVAMKRMQAFAQYVNSEINKYMSLFDFLVYYQGFTEAEAKSIEANGIKYGREEVLAEIKEMQAKIKAGILPDPTKPATPPSNGKPPAKKRNQIVAKPKKENGRPPVRAA
jgi:hypothetical protein